MVRAAGVESFTLLRRCVVTHVAGEDPLPYRFEHGEQAHRKWSCRLLGKMVTAAFAVLVFSVFTTRLHAQGANPTYMTASPSSLTMPGSITYCVGISNITVDLQYWYNGSFIEADGAVSFGSNGCVTNFYNYDGYAGTYTFVGIRNSALGGSFNYIHTVVTLYPSTPPPSINYFYPSPSTINAGDCTDLYYGTSNATSARINGQSVGTSGSYEVCLNTSTSYTLTAYNSIGQSTSTSTSVTVIPLYNGASFVAPQSIPSSMEVGKTYTFSITMQNTGTTAWSSGYALASTNSTPWGVSSVPLASWESIFPGDSKTFVFTVTAPSTAGTYYSQWKMRQGSSGWFGGASWSVPVSVNLPPPPPQPTSMSFSPGEVGAGNGGYTLTVGNGANMSIDFEYYWSGNQCVANTVLNWQPRLNASGQATVTVNHNDNQGVYTFSKIKNSLASDWVNLCAWPCEYNNTCPQFTIGPPVPFENSLIISPASLTPPASYTMSAGNMGSVTADTRYTLNGTGPLYEPGWPIFPWAANGSPGVVSIQVATCKNTGDYFFTGLRNSAKQEESPWINQNAAIHVNCPGGPALNPIQVGPVIAGNTALLTLAGQNLCGPLTIWSNENGIDFSSPAPDPLYAGSPASVTVSVASEVASGAHPFSLQTPCGQTTGTLRVDSNNAEFVSQTVPPSLLPGTVNPVSITFRNTGTTPWRFAGGYRLGSQSPTNNTVWGFSRVDLAAEETVSPGATKTFTFNVTAPTTPGPYDFQWQMVQNETQWFGAASQKVGIVVGVPPTVTSLTPSAGYQNQHDIPIEIRGTNLLGATLSVADNYRIAIGDMQVVDATRITATLYVAPDAPLGNAPISITTATGAVATNFMVNPTNAAGKPAVDSVSPGVLLAGASTTVTLSGSNLSQAEVNPDQALTVSNIDHVGDGELQFSVTTEASTPEGTYFLAISIPQFESTVIRLRVLPSLDKPSIEAFTPSDPAEGGAYLFHIEGSNLSGAQIEIDNPRVHISSSGVDLVGAQNQSAGFEAIAGMLTVDPGVPPDTPVTLTVRRGSQSESVIMHVAASGQNKKGAARLDNSNLNLFAQPLTPVKIHDYNPRNKPPQKTAHANFFGIGVYCDARCSSELKLFQFSYTFRWIDCGGYNVGDSSCFAHIKWGDGLNGLKNIRFGFIGITVNLVATVAELTIVDNFGVALWCTGIPCTIGPIYVYPVFS